MPDLEKGKKNKYSNQDNFIFILYSLYFILKPFYLWSSGLPQIADFILVFLIVIYLVKKDFRITVISNAKKFINIGLILVTYIVIVNLIWLLVLNSSNTFILASIFYIYNFTIAVIVVSLYSDYKNKLIEVTYKATLISIFIQMILYMVGGGFTGGRMTGGFNNPNQLGYYSLLVACFIMFSSQVVKVQAKYLVLGIIFSMILVLSSLSKAAIISYFGLLLFFLIAKNSNQKFKRNFLVIVLFITGISTYVYNTTDIIQESRLLQSVQGRLEGIGNDSDDSLQGRGYLRITEYPKSLLFGAGEGDYSRFKTLNGMEFHSTLGNIQVSYGLIGLLIFLAFIFLALGKNKQASWYIILFIMIYGLTHNGIRNSMFWILIALTASQINSLKSKQEEAGRKFS
jgi:hypothetical protein